MLTEILWCYVMSIIYEKHTYKHPGEYAGKTGVKKNHVAVSLKNFSLLKNLGFYRLGKLYGNEIAWKYRAESFYEGFKLPL